MPRLLRWGDAHIFWGHHPARWGNAYIVDVPPSDDSLLVENEPPALKSAGEDDPVLEAAEVPVAPLLESVRKEG